MKKVILFVVYLVAGFSAYSQMGVGTVSPHASAMLDVTAPLGDKGVLIPRVALQGTALMAPITAVTQSLLIFNTATVADVAPGFYYWDNNKWNRVVVKDEVTSSEGSVVYDSTNNQFTYIDANGDVQFVDMESMVKLHETLTKLELVGDQ